MARHEEISVGKLVITEGVYDEDGNLMIADGAEASSTLSNVTSNTETPVANSVTASVLSAGSILASAISIAVASHPSEGTNLSHILSATQSGAADATNSSSASLNSLNISTTTNSTLSNTSSAASAVVDISTTTNSTLSNTSSAASELAYNSSVVTNSTTGSTGLNWDETLSELGSDITATSTASQAGSAAKQNNPVFGTVWFEVMSLIESASA